VPIFKVAALAGVSAAREKTAIVGVGADVGTSGNWGFSVGFPYGVAATYRMGDADAEWGPAVGWGLTGPFMGATHRSEKVLERQAAKDKAKAEADAQAEAEKERAGGLLNSLIPSVEGVLPAAVEPKVPETV